MARRERITITDRAQLAETRDANPDATIICAPPGEPRYFYEPGRKPRWIGFAPTPITRKRAER